MNKELTELLLLLAWILFLIVFFCWITTTAGIPFDA